MAKICPLYSGSDGNSTLISGVGGAILIDAGVSYKGLCEALLRAGSSIEEISAVAVTHEHSDNIKGLKTLLSKRKIPIIASEKTLESLAKYNALPENATVISANEGTIEVGSLTLSRFATSHDCDGSGGYTVTLPDGTKVGVCTDLGVVTDEVRNSLSGCKAIVFESNHDLKMLKEGPYPPHLKMRIMSDAGHLSNNASAAELPAFLNGGTNRIILAHLSKNNNMPMLALSCARASLLDIGAQNGIDYILTAAKPCFNEVTLL